MQKMSSQSRKAQESRRNIMKKCYCGLNTVIKTSTTMNNRVRRFRDCPLFPRNVTCDFFQWIDEKTIPPASNEQIWEDDILECRVRAIELERELEAAKKAPK